MTAILSSDQALAKLQALPRPWAGQYLAMYSSQWQGIVCDPWLMMIPIDDHMAHRGDGVFEAIKCAGGALYELDRHLKRLERSAKAIYLKLPFALERVKELALQVVKAGEQRNCLLRIYVSRGPGSLNADPSESIGPQLYMVACTPHAPAEDAYVNGVKVGFSRSPIKMDFHAQVKSCSYLPNVLAKHDAIKNGWNYPLWTGPDGVVSEGSTENFIIADVEDRLIFPDPSRMVEGITVLRAKELAQSLLDNNAISAIEERLVMEDEVRQAKEIMILSTSLNVLPATQLEGRAVGSGKPGKIAKALLELMQKDIAGGSRSTRVWAE